MAGGSHDVGGSGPDQAPVTPEFARRERRRTVQAGVFGVVMSLVTLADSLHAMRTGALVFNRVGGVGVPAWMAAGVGCAGLLVSLAVLWRFAVKR